MATGDDAYKPFELGGRLIDLDNLHSTCDSGTIDTVTNVAGGTITEITNITGGTISSSLSFEHEKVDVGLMYNVSDYHSVASGGTRLVTLSSYGTSLHIFIKVSTSAAAKIRTIEGGTTTPAATILPYNRDRDSANVLGCEWITGTVLAGGTVLHQDYVPGGQGPFSLGASSTDDVGWLTMTDKEFCIEVVDLSAGANVISTSVNFYAGT